MIVPEARSAFIVLHNNILSYDSVIRLPTMSLLKRIFARGAKKPSMTTSNGVEELTAGLGRLKIEEETKKIPYETATLALS